MNHLSNPETVIGVPCFGNKPSTLESIRSLMATLDSGVLLVVSLENFNSEEAGLVCQQLSKFGDNTIQRCGLMLLYQTRRLKLVKHWNFLIDYALCFDSCMYFAWGSDHDIWDKNWYALTKTDLILNPNSQLAVPQMAIKSADGLSRLAKSKKTELGRFRVIENSLGPYGPGNSVYGLFRTDVFKIGLRLNEVLLPDRLLLTLVALWNPITYLQFNGTPLWTRVEVKSKLKVLAKQRSTLLNEKSAKAMSYLPWTLIHLVYASYYLPRVCRVAGRPMGKSFVDLFVFELRSQIAHMKKKYKFRKLNITK